MPFNYFEELLGYPVQDITPVSRRATRQARIPGDQIDNLVDFIFPLGDFGRAFPGNAALRAANMHIEPFVGEDNPNYSPTSTDLSYDSINTYEYLRVTIEYETMQADADQGNDPQLLIQQRWSLGGEMLTVPNAGLEWSDGGYVSEDVNAAILIPMIEHQVTWMRVERPPFAVMRDRIGTVNNAVVQFKTGDIYAETLIFLGAELNRDILTSGALAWQVGYHFSERRVVGLAIDDALVTQVTCEAEDGIWNATTSKCALKEVGGWNHTYRSEDIKHNPRVTGLNGFYRLRTKPQFDDALTTSPACVAGGGTWDATLNKCVVGGRDPLYRLTSFTELFQQAP